MPASVHRRDEGLRHHHPHGVDQSDQRGGKDVYLYAQSHAEHVATSVLLQHLNEAGFRLRVLVDTVEAGNSHVVAGRGMGFQYELADPFTRSLGVKLKIKVAQNARDLVHKLLQGEGDLIAYNLPVTKEFKDSGPP